MSEETRKLRIIDMIMRIDDEAVLSELETIIEQSDVKPEHVRSLEQLAGIWTEEEAEKMKKDIEEACEQIHPDNWK
jgi:hypothetical protein